MYIHDKEVIMNNGERCSCLEDDDGKIIHYKEKDKTGSLYIATYSSRLQMN